jgi:hypothetical protein
VVRLAPREEGSAVRVPPLQHLGSMGSKPSRSAWGHRLTCGTAKGTHPCNSRHFRRSLTSPAPRHWL